MTWPPSVVPLTRTAVRAPDRRIVALAARGTPVMRATSAPSAGTCSTPNTAPGGGRKRTVARVKRTQLASDGSRSTWAEETLRLLQLVGVLAALALRERGAAGQQPEPEEDQQETAHRAEGTSPRAGCGKK